MTQILQWNCRGFYPQLEELKLLVRTTNAACLCLQETNFKVRDSPLLRGYTFYRSDFTSGDRACGGVAVVVRNDIVQTPLTLHTRLQACAVRVSVKTDITVCSIYLNPAEPLDLGKLDDLLAELPTPVILMGDFNCHNEMWGSVSADTRGRRLERWLSTNDLVLLNSGEKTHFCSATGGFSCLDLAFCSPRIASKLSWRVVPDLHGSDHFPVSTTLEGRSTPSPNQRARWIFEKADWTDFSNHIQFREVESFESVDDLTDHFTKVVLTAAEATIPRSSGKLRRTPIPWWSEECRIAIRERRRALRAFRASPTMERRLIFLRLRARARRIIKEHKRASWLSYISTINRTTPMSEVWNKVRRITGRKGQPRMGLSVNGSQISSPEEIATTLAESFAEASSTRQYDPYFRPIKDQAERKVLNFKSQNLEDYNSLFTEWELSAALSSAKDTAPGPDGIHCQFLRHLPPEGMSFLLEMLNRIWTSNSFPTAWRTATIIPIPKPGKDASVPGNYRPISLTSCVCKIYERMANWRLVWFLETHNLLHNTQCGFRRNRSSIDHLVNLETYGRETFLNRQHLLAVFFDIEKAYDTSWRYGILRTLHNWGLRGRMAHLVCNFMRHRSFRVRVDNHLSDSFPLENGVPQGSVLSVTLFAVAINPIAEIAHTPVSSSLFVDDFGAMSAGHSLPAAERRLQLTINKVYDWGRSNGYRFSKTKTVCMHFCRKRGVFPEPSLRLGPDPIPVVETTRFLGLTLDKKLTWIPHLKLLRTNCLQRMNVIRVLGGTKWGADRTILLRMYRALVRSKLDYGCFVYGSARPSALRMLDPIHHRGIRLATGAFYTSPVASLYAESGEPPLVRRREELFLRYAGKLKGMSNHPTYAAVHVPRYEALFAHRPSCIPSVAIRLIQLMESLGLAIPSVLPINNSDKPPWSISRPKTNLTLAALTKKSTPRTVYQQAFYEQMSNYHGYERIYTDGSKCGDDVGCSVVCARHARGYRLCSQASSYTAEVIAIQQAIEFALDVPGKYLVITDSLSAIHAIDAYYPASPLIQNVQDLLAELLRRGSEAVFCWVPSHVGIAGNEAADAAACAAASRPDIDFHAVPNDDLSNHFHRCIRDAWELEWSNTTENKLRIIKSTTKVWGTSFRKSREEETALTRLRIGHCRLSHSHLLRGDLSPICPCGEDLTVRHFLCDCALYVGERLHNNIATDIGDILGDNDEALRSMFSFLHETGLLPRL